MMDDKQWQYTLDGWDRFSKRIADLREQVKTCPPEEREMWKARLETTERAFEAEMGKYSV